ncbi:hypothetical protein T492DRAFT_518462 [Pavlovales sp. CCMP2436]|nr:hypothetical protein T492DRAFT_518462 [Pavlovales sp. CCMP2436]
MDETLVPHQHPSPLPRPLLAWTREAHLPLAHPPAPRCAPPGGMGRAGCGLPSPFAPLAPFALFALSACGRSHAGHRAGHSDPRQNRAQGQGSEGGSGCGYSHEQNHSSILLIIGAVGTAQADKGKGKTSVIVMPRLSTGPKSAGVSVRAPPYCVQQVGPRSTQQQLPQVFFFFFFFFMRLTHSRRGVVMQSSYSIVHA